LCIGVAAISLGALWMFGPGGSGSSPTRTREAPYGIVSLQIAGTEGRAKRIVTSWGADGLEHARQETFRDWLMLIPGYVLFLSLGVWASGISLSWHGWCGWARAGRWVAIGIVVAGILDAIENIFLLCMIGHAEAGRALGSICPAGSITFAAPKILLLLLGVLYVLLGLSSWPIGAVVRRV
jgi:hypothetical protein